MDVTDVVLGGGGTFGDYDSDGDLDLYVPVGAYESRWRHSDVLLRNDQGNFRDVTTGAGLMAVLSTDNAIWLDYDRDGDIDLYIGTHSTPETWNMFYANNGDGTFTDVTEEVGLNTSFGPEGGSTGGMAAGDFNNDGWPDLYVGVFRDRNRLFLNDGQGGFRDATTDEIGHPGDAFGVAVGDADNDGDLDIFQNSGGGTSTNAQLERSPFLINLGEGQFLDATEGLGLAGLASQNASGSGLADIDNDGDLDLLVAQPHFLFINNGDGTFTDQTGDSGIDHVGLTVSFGDYDLDGFLDVVFGGSFIDDESAKGDDVFGGLYRNRGNDNHWLRVELVGRESNRNGIGARVIAVSEDMQQMREILGGLGLYQDEMVAHFGLGQRTQVERLEIHWPSGQVEIFRDIPADQKIRVMEGNGEYYAALPYVWQHNLPDSVVTGTHLQIRASFRPVLFEPDAQIAQVRVDLSELGGPADLLLELVDGHFRLEEPLEVDAPAGLHRVSVLIEQNTEIGLYWTRLSKTINVLSGLQDEEEQRSGDWIEKAPLPTARHSFTTAVVDGKIYAFGGRVSSTDGLSMVEAYNPQADTWSTKTDMPTGRRGAGAAVVDGKIYVIGGLVGNPSPASPLATVEVYDPATDTWGKKADMPHARGFLSADAVNGKIYVVAGWQQTSATNIVGEYDPSTDRWIEKSPLPVSISHHGSTSVDNILYIAGGANDPKGLWAYDPLIDEWSEKTRMPTSRQSLALTAVDGIIYAIGGTLNQASGRLASNLGRYDLATDTWTEPEEMPTPRAGLSAAVVDGTIYLMGGVNGLPWIPGVDVLATVDAFIPAEGHDETAVIEDRASTLPQAFTLDQNYPNPFNSATVIRFALPISTVVELAIFNLAGQRVATLADGMRQAGTYTIRWDGRDDDGRTLASGVYLYRLRTGDRQQQETRKLLLLR